MSPIENPTTQLINRNDLEAVVQKITEKQTQSIFQKLDRLVEIANLNKLLLSQILYNSDIIRTLNTLSSSFIPLTITVTTVPIRLFRADWDRAIIISRPGLVADGTGQLFIGSSNGVSTTSGFPVVSTFPLEFYILRNTEVWGISDTSIVCHILAY